MIDHFDLAAFQSALPKSAESLELVDGEFAFRVPAGAAFIEVRSSIGANGKSADTGEDSIRAWLVNADGDPLGAKLSKYITRVSGWQNRLMDTLEELYSRAFRAGRCERCGSPKSIFVSKTHKNPNRLFAKCYPCDDGFVWLDSQPLPMFSLYSEANNKAEASKNGEGTEVELLASESGREKGKNDGDFDATSVCLPDQEGAQVSPSKSGPRRRSLFGNGSVQLHHLGGGAESKSVRVETRGHLQEMSGSNESNIGEKNGDFDTADSGVQKLDGPGQAVASPETSRRVAADPIPKRDDSVPASDVARSADDSSVPLGVKRGLPGVSGGADDKVSYLKFGKRGYASLPKQADRQESEVAHSGHIATGGSPDAVREAALPNGRNGRLGNGEGVPLVQGFKFGQRANFEVIEEPEDITVVAQPVQFTERKPNAEQQAVIDLPVNCAARVLAGPGSGKTFLIEHRIRKLIDSGVNPAKILVVTLTNTMATAMGQRIVKLNPSMEARADHICTIHAACNRILKEEIGPRQVAKSWQVRKCLEQLAKELWSEDQRPGYAEIDAWIQLAKRNGLSSGEDLVFFNERLGSFHGDRLHQARIGLDTFLQAQRMTTFADMLFEVDLRLAHDAAFRARQQSKFSHVIIDEGQDTGGQAMRILTTIAQPENNLLIVADTDQTLFRFTGATPETNVYDGFTERYPNGETRKLVTNYRSTVEVVEAQKRLIAHNYSDKGGIYHQSYFKQLCARVGAEQGKAISFTMYATADEEARSIVNQILGDRDKPEDVFIITRTRAQAAWFEGPLSRANIPYLNLNGGSFWSLRHVRNIVNYVRLASHYDCDEAFKDVYNIATNDFRVPWVDEPYCNHRYLGNAFVEACGGSWKGIGKAIYQRRSWGIGAEDLQSFIYDIHLILIENGLVVALQYVIDKCYRKWLMHDEGLVDEDNAEGGKFEDLGTLLGIAGEYQDPDKFFAFVDGMQKADKAKNDKDWSGKLVIFTAHKSKGLERPTVYAPGWCEGKTKTGQPFGLLPHTFSLTQPPQLGILPMNGQGRIEDELDIAFVMVSRAMSKVVLSGYQVDKRGAMEPSRFVKYIMERNIQ